MGRNPKIKLKVYSEKQLNSEFICECGKILKLKDTYSQVDESNIRITDNAKNYCFDCCKKQK